MIIGLILGLGLFLFGGYAFYLDMKYEPKSFKILTVLLNLLTFTPQAIALLVGFLILLVVVLELIKPFL
jgi:uncharacterized membrane protein